MNRGATSAFLTELAKAGNQPILLVKCQFDGGDVFVTNAYVPVIYDGDSYTNSGDLLSITDVEENLEMIITTVTLKLSGIDLAWESLVLSEDYVDRPITIYFGFLDSDGSLIADPILWFDGVIDKAEIDETPEAETCEVTITVANQWANFNRVAGRYTNHEDQQIYFSGDMGFEYASEIIKDIYWGSLPITGGDYTRSPTVRPRIYFP